MAFINILYGIFAFLILGTSFVTILLLPQSLRFLRITRIYNQVLFLCVILLLVGIGLQFQDNYNCDERHYLFYPLYPIVFLSLYKITDIIILKKLNRHMYYLTMRHVVDEESSNSTFLENIIQFIIISISIYVPMVTSSWILKIWGKC